MTTEDNAVKATGDAADQGAVNKNESAAAEIQTEDYLAVIEAKDAELVKIRGERENYRKGMLKAKGKLDDDGTDDEESTEEKMRRIIREENLASKESEVSSEKDNAIKALAKRNKELETALKNRSQIGNGVGAGNSSEATVIPDSQLSVDQIKNLKAKGWSDDKIETFKKNLIKNRG